MKKILCLILTLAMLLSSFALCLSVSAEGEKDFLYRPDGTNGHEDIVGKVLDPILANKNTVFADSINELGYAGVNNYAANNMVITKETFDSFITTNADQQMLGVDLDMLYSKDNSAFFWTYSRYKLEKDPHIHEKEVAQAEAEHRYSTCAMKGAYDACAEVLNGYRYQYEKPFSKETDKKVFADIIEEKIIVHNDYTNRDEIHYNYYYDLTKGSFSLMRANANNQIIDTISKVWKTKNSFTWKTDTLCESRNAANTNAIKIANFIGNLLYPNFVEIPDGTEIFTDNKKIDINDFFIKITEISGLDDILQDNWCSVTTFNVKDIMKALGVNTAEDVLLNVETEKGVYMGARILHDMFKSFYSNPVLYVEQLLQLFCKSYNYSFQRAVESLFTLKYPSMAGKSHSGSYEHLDRYDGSELKSVDGLINFITDCIYVEKVDSGNASATKFSFAPLPVKRIVNAADVDELHLYLLCYMDINRIYENNAGMIDKFINDVVAANKASDIKTTAKVLRSLFSGELTMKDVLSFHLGELTENTFDSFENNFVGNIKNAIVAIFQKFIDAMDSLMNLLFGWVGI